MDAALGEKQAYVNRTIQGHEFLPKITTLEVMKSNRCHRPIRQQRFLPKSGFFAITVLNRWAMLR